MVVPEVLEAVRRAFAASAVHAVAAYVFGSVARGDAGPESDLDLAVILGGDRRSALPNGPLLDLVAALERATGRRVDLALLDAASPDFIHRVLRDGILVHEGDAPSRVAFEVDARNAYFDLLPTLRAYRRAAIRSA